MDELASPTREDRYDVDIAVDCRTRDMVLANHVTNLSRGGMFIRGERPLPIDAEVQLRFRLPDAGVVIHAAGRVVWNYDIARGTTHLVPGSGIKFVALSRPDREAIERYLARLATTPAAASPDTPRN
jgi:uncharacterized protein (TIGR02266 family)